MRVREERWIQKLKKGSEARQELLMRSTESLAGGRREKCDGCLINEVILIDLSHQSIRLCVSLLLYMRVFLRVSQTRQWTG